MATIQNRSPLIVTVPRKPELRREFRYDHLDDAEQYMRELAAGTHTAGKRVQPKIEQGTTSWEVRCRDKGFPDINVTFATEKEARDFEELVRVERKQGIVKDYNRAHGVTYADMLVQHLATHRRPKTFDADFYKIAAWLNDSGPHGQKLLEKFRSEHPADAKPLPALKHAMREPMKELEWIHKRLSKRALRSRPNKGCTATHRAGLLSCTVQYLKRCACFSLRTCAVMQGGRMVHPRRLKQVAIPRVRSPRTAQEPME